MIKSAERQWESQKIANKIKLAPEIFFTDYNAGIIYTIMEKIENDKIEIITGDKNFNFAYEKRFEILESLKNLHNNNVLHGDILTSASIYTGQIHNIYYDNNKICFIVQILVNFLKTIVALKISGEPLVQQILE